MNDTTRRDHKNSVVLAKAMGWYAKSRPEETKGEVRVSIYDSADNHIISGFDYETTSEDIRFANALNFGGLGSGGANFYKPTNMHLAWRVLNWGGGPGHDELMCMWFYNNELTLEPDAQRLWLDKVVELISEREDADE